MTTVGAQYFIDHCSEELESLDDDGLVILRDGVPYAKLSRLEPVEQDDTPPDMMKYHGILKGKLKIRGDLDGPVHPWDPGKFDQR